MEKRCKISQSRNASIPHRALPFCRELRGQAWRERVACGDVVEMSSSEAKRLRWSEEQAELMREANANLRYGVLLPENVVAGVIVSINWHLCDTWR